MTANPENVAMGERLREARLAAGYKTAAKAAKAAGMSSPGYWRIEKGINGLGIERATQLGRLFNKNVNYLLTGDTDDKSAGGVVAERPQSPPPLPEPAKAVIALLRGAMSKGVAIGERAFLIPLDDRAMTLPGKIELGDFLAFDPDRAPIAGDLIALRNEGAEAHLIRRYMPSKSGNVRLLPLDSSFEAASYKKGKLPEILGCFIGLWRNAANAY